MNISSKSSYPTSQNGVILDQVFGDNYGGYTVMSVWGSDYEMGYALGELTGYAGVLAINFCKDSLGEDYNLARELAADLVWMPPEIEDQIDGMVDYLTVTFPSENIDEQDVKVYSMIAEWWYRGCRAHMCWGRYVEDPIKTLTTVRLDWGYELYHHILCAYDPDDGSPRRVIFDMGGGVGVSTGVNEFGTVIRPQDYYSHDLDMTAGRMSRGIAARYALTFATNPDVSTHLDSVYAELQKYEVISGGFLNYYTPEGHGGVLTSNPFQTGPDFYHLRKPQESWHHGEVIITTNKWTDGTYTPNDVDFGADSYYDDESPKTLESHWNLLDTGLHEWKSLQLFSVAYRGPADMTIWADGKISSSKRTPRLEYEWSDLFFEPPIMNEIDGLTSGKAGEEHEYTFSATDPDGDDVTYVIDWGDNSGEESFGPYPSGEQATAKHVWKDGYYIIKAKAVDTYGKESDFATLEVCMSKTKVINSPFLQFLENNPNLFPLLRQLLGL